MSINGETLAVTDQMRQRVAAHVDATTQDLALAWARAWNEVAGEWDAAVADLIAASKDGKWPPPGKVRRARRALRARDATRELLEDLRGMVPARIEADLPGLAEEAAEWQRRLAASQYPPQAGGTVLVASNFDRVDPDAIRAIVDKISGDVRSRSWPLSTQAEAAMRSTLVKGVTVGQHPTAAAREMVARVRGDFNGGLRRAQVIARTEMLDAHREASRAQQDRLARQGVVTGWTWMATLDHRTCFPAGTLITTSKGDKPVEQIETGDIVLSHTGQWRRAYEPMSRTYSGAMVTLTAGNFTVTCTSDHPVLIEREGKLQWMEARGIRRGDSVLSHLQSGADSVDHALGERPVERRRVESQHRNPAALHEGILAGVTVSGAGVPVGLVDLDTDPSVGEVEVDGALPARHGVLLDEVAAERFEREPHVGLGLGLSGVASVAARRAEAAPVRRGTPEGVTADGAFDVLGRPSALFRAVGQRAALRVEDATADLTRSEGDVSVGALGGAVVVPGGVGARDGEGRTAADARLGHTAKRGHALPGARLAGALGAGLEGLTAVRALALNARRRVAALAAVRLLPLVGVVAVSGAEASGRLASGPRRRDLEKGAAPLASKFHRHIVSSVATHYQTLTVHNFEVEVDHSYVANGIAVHNCPSCLAMHGTVHPPSVAGPLDHQQGRCDRLPVTASWRDLGFEGVEEPPSIVPDAREWFDGLPESQREHIMGATRLALLDSGHITWEDLAQQRRTPGWRPSYAPTPVGDLAIQAS